MTSIENRDRIPLQPPAHPHSVDLANALHPEAWSIFDCHPLIWPERATDAGLFLQGRRFQAERYLVHLEAYFAQPLSTARQLQDAVQSFFRKIIRRPTSYPRSRVLYVNCFQAEDWRFCTPYSSATVKYTPRHQRDRLEGDMRRQVIACVAEAMLCALNDVGREYTQRGERFGCSLQLCAGTKHFMDWTRQLQSIPAPFPQLARDEDAVWMRYPDVHFECICAHESICRDLACGFTDARFVEMIAAKYRSLRLGIVDALADLLDDESSALHRDYDEGAAAHQPRGGAPHSGCSIGMNARISLVTGGSRGLGAAICTRFAEEGYAVAIEYASHEKAATETAAMVREQQHPVAPFRADASDETEVRDMIRRMREEPGARRIITLSSQGVRRGSIAHAHCAASKMGIIGCTRSLARELGADGIAVNAVAPGRVMADMLRANLAHSEKTETWLRETPWGDSGNRGRSRRRSRSRVGPGLLRHGPGDARRWRIADAVMVGPTLRLRQRNWHATGTTSASVTSMPGASRSSSRTFSSNSAPSRSCGHQLI